LARASQTYVLWKLRKLVATDLRRTSRATTADEAAPHLEKITRKWTAYPSVSQVWQRNGDHITPFFGYLAHIHKAIYTSNSVEPLHRSLRKIIKTRGAFPNEESAADGVISGHPPGVQEVDHAGAELEPSLKLPHRPVARTHATARYS
jgi:putative transposase